MQEIQLQDILQNTQDFVEKKVGYVAIIGRPNTGKSTFLNALIGEKVSITTNVPQTTRKKVLGIYNDTEHQIIFIDTPGLHKNEKLLNQTINAQATGSLKDANVVLYFVDLSRDYGEEEKFIENILKDITTPILRIGTKTDLPQRNTTSKTDISISTLENPDFSEIVTDISKHLLVAPMLFPDDMYTKQDIYFRISEIIREKAFLVAKEELPHSIYIAVEEIEDRPEILRISAYIYTDTESQKYIIIGKNGSLIGDIGKQARLELEKIFDKKVFLALRAKTRKNWKKDENFLKQMFQ